MLVGAPAGPRRPGFDMGSTVRHSPKRDRRGALARAGGEARPMAALTASEGVSRLLSLVFYVVAARTLTTEGFGVLRYTVGLALLIFALLAVLTTSVTREVGAARGNDERTGEVLGSGLWVAALLVGVSSVVCVLASLLGLTGGASLLGLLAVGFTYTVFQLYYAISRGVGDASRAAIAYVCASAAQLILLVALSEVLEPTPGLALFAYGASSVLPVLAFELRRPLIRGRALSVRRVELDRIWKLLGAAGAGAGRLRGLVLGRPDLDRERPHHRGRGPLWRRQDSVPGVPGAARGSDRGAAAARGGAAHGGRRGQGAPARLLGHARVDADLRSARARCGAVAHRAARGSLRGPLRRRERLAHGARGGDGALYRLHDAGQRRGGVGAPRRLHDRHGGHGAGPARLPRPHLGRPGGRRRMGQRHLHGNRLPGRARHPRGEAASGIPRPFADPAPGYPSASGVRRAESSMFPRSKQRAASGSRHPLLRRILLLGGIAVLVAYGASWAISGDPETAPREILGQNDDDGDGTFHVEDGHIVDPDGRRFVVKGVVAVHGAFAGGDEAGFGATNYAMAVADLARIRGLGVNLLRLLITPRSATPPSSTGCTAWCAPRASGPRGRDRRRLHHL